MSSLERRYTALPVEARGGDGSMKIGGYAAVFNRVSQNLGGFVEVVAPGAFADSRSRGWPDVMARYNHDDMALLGTTGGGTLSLGVDDTGLEYDVVVPRGLAIVHELVGRGDVRKSSFAFRVLPGGDEWTMNDQNYPQRTLLNLQLIDVAPVNSPAYTDTTAGKRQFRLVEEARGGLESLAVKMAAPVDDVLELAKQNELRKFFVKTTDAGKPAPKPMTRAQLGALINANSVSPVI